VQSAGVKSELEIDGFAIAVCAELGVELERHRVRSFDEMQEWGDDISGFDLIVALSPASQRRALDLTRHFHLDVEYWPILDPTGLGETREAKLAAYRQARDQIVGRMKDAVRTADEPGDGPVSDPDGGRPRGGGALLRGVQRGRRGGHARLPRRRRGPPRERGRSAQGQGPPSRRSAPT
jgi:protein-tyrosine-phosphatase